MADIPEDICEIAQRIAGDWVTDGSPLGFSKDIAEAILAERERCARIADEYRARLDIVGDAPHAAMAYRNVAAAIRGS